nr:altered inheritance of mitochondria protein 32 [Quercus suber]
MARRNREEALTFTNPSSSSSPITVSDPLDAEFGFSRPDFRTSQLAGSVEFYQRHVFLCYKNPQVWPSKIEDSEFDQVPRLLFAAVMARKADMNKETRLTICEGHDGTETSNGDVLIFPDMIRYRDREEALTFTNPSSSSSPITVSDPLDAEFGFSRPDFRTSQLAGSVEFYQRHVFLCYKNPQVWPSKIEDSEFDQVPRLLFAAVMARKADMNKETRLTICEGHDGTETSNGDVLIFPDMIRYRFKEEIELHGVQSTVSVSPCSHLGGHKYAGNVIIFGSKINGEVTGHWYGYVTPEDVPVLLEQHILKGEIVDWLWRGEMGFSEEEQKKSQEKRIKLNGETDVGKNAEELSQTHKSEKDTAACRSRLEVKGCCQGNGNLYCCQNPVFPEKLENLDANVGATKVISDKNSSKELNSGIKSLL